MSNRIDPPNPRCEHCGDELTDEELAWAEEEGDGLCSPCAKVEYEDPDQRLGGYDCVESYGPMGIYHLDSDYF